ncbi:MAG: type II toxin-antitoxin system HicA family toxin [Euryarchaeota archaeon]|nr:type II toxin-antitoxin system HicA family toxin [Euryarchaeota archaeon]
MTRLPALIARDVIRKLKRAGFVFDRQAKGSHEIWYNPITKRRTTIPNHLGVAFQKERCERSSKEQGLSWKNFWNCE